MARRTALLFLLALPVGCANPQPACRALVEASPADWPAHWAAVRAFGPSAAPALVAEVRASPEAPGAQAAIHLLGTLRATSVRGELERMLVEGTGLSSEAALALGKIQAPESIPVLRRVVGSEAQPVTTRAAAAAALVSMGQGPEVVDFLEAVFLAATPYGAESTRSQGLPRRKQRWALERYMILEALRGRYPEHQWILDEDASYPALREGAADLRSFLTAAG